MKYCLHLKQSTLQLLLPLRRLLQDGFPPLVEVLQFALQTSSFLSSAGLYQIITGLVDGLDCRLMSQHIILENL